MKNSKKLIALLLVLVMTLALAYGISRLEKRLGKGD